MEYLCNQLKDTDYIEGLRREDRRIIQCFVAEYSPRVIRFLISKGAMQSDADDILSVVMMAFLQYSRKKNFSLSCSLSNFLFSIAIRQLYKQKRDRKEDSVTIEPEMAFTSGEEWLDTIEETERRGLFWEKFYKLSDNCQQLLKLFFNNISFKEIAEKMEFNTEGAARKRKYDCYKKLEGMIKKDARYNGLSY